ncbi:VOC family protein [Eubacteriales bacterium OttesenSCG-928-N14]|nr:VOC family protein [Eubacteriales bacterium OttesenSCG-928-N14]
MAILGLHHMCIVVKDLAASMKFYNEVLGFPVTRTVDGEFLATYLQMPGSGELELIDRKGKQHTPETDGMETGYAHYAFLVDDPVPYYNLMIENGYEVDLKPTKLDAYGHYACILHDPDGVMLEFIAPYDPKAE